MQSLPAGELRAATTTAIATNGDLLIASQALDVEMKQIAGSGEHAPGSIFVMPKFSTVDAHGEAEVTFKLPRFLTRVAAGSGQVSAKLERLPIHEAVAVEVEISWSDKPFYSDPRKKKTSAREQLVSWPRGTVRKRSTGAAPPERK